MRSLLWSSFVLAASGACDYPAAVPPTVDGLDATAGHPEVSPADTIAADTTALDTTTADTITTDTTAAETIEADTAPADTTFVEPEIEGDPSMPGPLPDMGLPPLGYLNSPPFGVTSTTCGTASWWWGYTLGSENMQPGGACIDCHEGDKGPHFSFAGTVMADYNDADECRGIPGVTVDIIDADGRVALTMVSNGAGNFYSESSAPVAMPYTARLTLNGRTREMDEPVDRGDCNACHTSTGAEDAPGRIILP